MFRITWPADDAVDMRFLKKYDERQRRLILFAYAPVLILFLCGALALVWDFWVINLLFMLFAPIAFVLCLATWAIVNYTSRKPPQHNESGHPQRKRSD